MKRSPRLGIEAALFESEDGRLPRAYACQDRDWFRVGAEDERAVVLVAYIKHVTKSCPLEAK